jgi:hypothetical protein
MIICTFLRGMIKKLVIFAYMAVFGSYCPQFWGSGVIYKVHDTQYMFERHDQTLIIFAFKGCFRELLPTILGFLEDLQGI